MAITAVDAWQYVILAAVASTSLAATCIGLVLLKALYNISPLHPLSKYPGPLLWRASRLPASYNHATGRLYQRIATIHEQYGETVRIAPDELSFTSPEAWPQIFNSRPQLQKTKYHFGSSGRKDIPESMIMAPDAEHMRLRRLANPAFLNSGVYEVEDVLQHYVDLLCAQLRESSQGGQVPQNMVEWYLWALNDVIGQLALGQEFECLQQRRMHPWPGFLLGALKQTAVMNQFRRFGISFQVLTPLLLKSARQRIENFGKTALAAINKRLAQIQDDESSGSKNEKRRQDIIGLMMREMKGGEKLTVGELTTNSILIVGGGAETTSTCLSATTYHLARTPRVLNKLCAEIRGKFSSSEDITLKATAELPYLKACIDESLRIFPVASYITPRQVPRGGHVVNGDVIPEGTYVTMGQWYMGRAESVFDNAKDFFPERWLTPGVQSVSGRNVDEILRPFSLGPRNCIGKILALAEIRLVLAKLLWHFDLELETPQESWVEDARFYILWELQPLKIRLTPVER